MKCPKCDSTHGSYEEYESEYTDEHGTDIHYFGLYWQCHICNHWVQSYEDGFEYAEE